jgi:hypothetical protein
VPHLVAIGHREGLHVAGREVSEKQLLRLDYRVDPEVLRSGGGGEPVDGRGVLVETEEPADDLGQKALCLTGGFEDLVDVHAGGAEDDVDAV